MLTSRGHLNKLRSAQATNIPKVRHLKDNEPQQKLHILHQHPLIHNTQKFKALYYKATVPLSHQGCHAGITDGRKIEVHRSGGP
jgi:hypothetical protein